MMGMDTVARPDDDKQDQEQEQDSVSCRESETFLFLLYLHFFVRVLGHRKPPFRAFRESFRTACLQRGFGL
jgi:hypothetical protein